MSHLICQISFFPCYFTSRLHYTWYQGETHKGAFNDPSADDLNPSVKDQGQIFKTNKKNKKKQKTDKNQTTGHILYAVSPIDFTTSIDTAFCDSFGRCPLVQSWTDSDICP